MKIHLAREFCTSLYITAKFYQINYVERRISLVIQGLHRQFRFLFFFIASLGTDQASSILHQNCVGNLTIEVMGRLSQTCSCKYQISRSHNGRRCKGKRKKKKKKNEGSTRFVRGHIEINNMLTLIFQLNIYKVKLDIKIYNAT